MLIVEDDESAREYLQTLLEQAGYAVIALADGRTALEYLQRVRADVLVLDLAVAETVHGHPSLSAIPVIVLAAVGAARRPGVAATLVKPITADDLLDAVRRVLVIERRRSRRYAASFDVSATSSDSSIRTTTCDVSSGGLSFDTAVAPRIGERIRVTVELAVHGVAAMDVEVRHVAPAHAGWRVGTRLVSFRANAVGFAAELALLGQTAASP